MTANDIYQSALELMGYNYSEDTAIEYPFSPSAISLCNRVFIDLGLESVLKISDELELSAEQCDAATYGVAMFISLYMCDSVKHAMITDIYNAKRRKIKASIGEIRNVMPYGEG